MLYYLVFSGLSHTPAVAVVLTGLFVAICQIKINVTNAYAGSIASSNFFSRLTHRHPGRVVWLVFNVMIALMLMEGGIQTVVERVLALYSNFAVARSEEHTSALQSLMRISYAVFCLKNKTIIQQ